MSNHRSIRYSLLKFNRDSSRVARKNDFQKKKRIFHSTATLKFDRSWKEEEEEERNDFHRGRQISSFRICSFLGRRENRFSSEIIAKTCTRITFPFFEFFEFRSSKTNGQSCPFSATAQRPFDRFLGLILVVRAAKEKTYDGPVLPRHGNA